MKTWNETMRELEERASKRNAERRARLQRLNAERAAKEGEERLALQDTAHDDLSEE